MTVKVAINGYGRIGRNIMRALYELGRNDEISVVAINDLGDANSNAHLTRYDTAHGKFPGTVSVEDGDLVINGLKELDQIAYIRYAIVYLHMDELGEIKKEIERLLEEG